MYVVVWSHAPAVHASTHPPLLRPWTIGEYLARKGGGVVDQRVRGSTALAAQGDCRRRIGSLEQVCMYMQVQVVFDREGFPFFFPLFLSLSLSFGWGVG